MFNYLRKFNFLVLVLFLSCLFVSKAFCTEREKVLVVYYSRDGHTKLVAEALAERFNADLERLIDYKKRTGPVAVSAAGKDAVTGKLTKISPLKHDLKEYGIILIGTPAWWGNITPAVRTFIKKYDLSGKKIGLFGTAHLTGIENALKQAAELINKDNADIIPTLPLRHRDLKEEALKEKIEDFYKRFQSFYRINKL